MTTVYPAKRRAWRGSVAVKSRAEELAAQMDGEDYGDYGEEAEEAPTVI